VIRCPVCGHENYAGEDACEECGGDLRTLDIPQDAVDFHGRLLGEHLDALGIERPPTVVAGTSARAAIARMKDDGLECLLVVDGDLLRGIVTYQDAIVKLQGMDLEGMVVDALMTPDPVVLRHDDTTAVALNKMAVGGFRHIPIVEDGRLVGLVQARNLFSHLLEVIG
jgi:signal-transduction protein with cAMP-binding, CBS, and nucleotidyltransferase domain